MKIEKKLGRQDVPHQTLTPQPGPIGQGAIEVEQDLSHALSIAASPKD